jgi:hypothetical protein
MMQPSRPRRQVAKSPKRAQFHAKGAGFSH